MKKFLRKVLVMSWMLSIMFQQICYAHFETESGGEHSVAEISGVRRVNEQDILNVKILLVGMFVTIGFLACYFISIKLKKDNTVLKNIRRGSGVFGIAFVIGMFFYLTLTYQVPILYIIRMPFEASFPESLIRLCVSIYWLALYVSPFILIYVFIKKKKNNGIMKFVNGGLLLLFCFMAFISTYHFVLPFIE